jgi:hypothetical protein
VNDRESRLLRSELDIAGDPARMSPAVRRFTRRGCGDGFGLRGGAIAS